MAEGYQLRAPRPSLDESPRWLWGADPPPAASTASAHPFRGGGRRGRRARLSRPEAVGLRSLDAVFGRPVTAQPPRWSGCLRQSEHLAFYWVAGPREAQARLAAAMCWRMLRAISLLYGTYKKRAVVLQHSRRAGALRAAGPGLAAPRKEGYSRGTRPNAITGSV
ncbi:LOW QUALITY PROTEIN: FANCD2 opposite strand protein [Haliaeetus albicilla]|uniref:LOW QUALITY PROTEIN: FANCD2 opposite strand protein n=1 Tax=Haliaeetus albicilla TaxID=8969 RepID=UPI0037E86481